MKWWASKSFFYLEEIISLPLCDSDRKSSRGVWHATLAGIKPVFVLIMCCNHLATKTLHKVHSCVMNRKAPKQLLNGPLRQNCFINCCFRAQEWTVKLSFQPEKSIHAQKYTQHSILNGPWRILNPEQVLTLKWTGLKQYSHAHIFIEIVAWYNHI